MSNPVNDAVLAVDRAVDDLRGALLSERAEQRRLLELAKNEARDGWAAAVQGLQDTLQLKRQLDAALRRIVDLEAQVANLRHRT